MESMEVITQGAGALSTYGLYAVCAVLALVVVHLYRKVDRIQEELKGAMIRHSESETKNADELRELVKQTQEIIKANTAAFEEFTRNIRRELRG